MSSFSIKNLFRLFTTVSLLGFTVYAASADTTENIEAKVFEVTGSAQVKLSPDAEAVPLYEGMSLPAGAVIITGADSEVELRTLAGGQTAVQANTTASLDELSVDRDNLGVITKQTATLSLRSGNLISTLDPKRKSINNYSVRTPKGVAAARGTVYAVTVSQTGTSVATLSGTVTLTPIGGGAPINVDIGTGMIVGADGTPTTTSLASLVQAEASDGTADGEGSITKAISQAVASVSKAVKNAEINTATNASAGAAATTAQTTSMLAAVVKVAAQANTTQAANYASTAVAAATASGQGSSVAAIAEAAAQGAVQGMLEQNSDDADNGAAKAKAVVQAIVDSANAAAGTSGNDTTIAAAVAQGSSSGTSAANATTNNQVVAPTVTLTTTDGDTNMTTEVTVEDTESTVITEIDPTTVSPSS